MSTHPIASRPSRHRLSRFRHTFFAIAALAVVVSTAPAQVPKLDEVIRANTYELTHETELGGPAHEFLMREFEGVQFIVLGEPHNADKVPQLAVQLLRAYEKPHGFRFLALEQGPFIVDALREAARRGGREAALEVAAKYPAALHFYTDQELHMIADAAALGDGAVPRVWGLDRTLSAVLPLEYLVERAPESARSALDELLQDSRAFDLEHLLEREQLLRSSPERFLKLAELFGPTDDAEILWRIDRTQYSSRNAQLYRDAKKGNSDGYTSNVEREDAMKDAFVRYYDAAVASGVETPRAVLKFGHYHSIRGRNDLNVMTLGNFLDGFARSNGLRSFSIDISLINPPGQYWSLTDYDDSAPIAAVAAVDKTVLIDLRPLRGLLHSGTFEINEKLRERVFGFDAALVIGDTKRGTTEWAERLLGVPKED